MLILPSDVESVSLASAIGDLASASGMTISVNEHGMHVWQGWLSDDGWPDLDGLPAVEQQRATKLREGSIRNYWVRSRWVLRRILAAYMGEDAVAIGLSAGKHGKPQLSTLDVPLRFNLSHSGDLALVAVTWECEVGVDVERIAPRKDLLALTRRGLAPEEAARIESLSEEERLNAFYAAWTRHEAVAKCHGVGLGAPLPEEPVAVANLDVSPGYAAAVAVTGEELPSLRRFELGPDLVPVALG